MVIIGCLSYSAQNLVRGLVLEPNGFYISIAAGCMGAMGAIGLRTYFSKLISTKEQGKVFSLVTTVEALLPLTSASIFAKLFNATMDTIPGISFIIIAIFNLVPIVIFVWIYFCAEVSDSSEYVIVNNDELDVNYNTIDK